METAELLLSCVNLHGCSMAIPSLHCTALHSLPACQSACLPVYLPASLPASLPACQLDEPHECGGSDGGGDASGAEDMRGEVDDRIDACKLLQGEQGAANQQGWRQGGREKRGAEVGEGNVIRNGVRERICHCLQSTWASKQSGEQAGLWHS